MPIDYDAYRKDQEGKTRSARDKDGKSYDVPLEMKYDEWHKTYVENDPVYLAKEKAWENRFSDKRQYDRYKELLGNKMPINFEKYQYIKYNDLKEWQRTQDNFYLENKFQKGIWKDEINTDKQSRHIKSSVGDNKSYFDDDVDIGALYKKYSGTGVIEKRNGKRTHREFIDFEEEVKGFDVLSNKPINSMTIHYSKTGTHLIPTFHKEKK